MSNMSISKLGGNVPYSQYIENHPNPYNHLPLNHFGGLGSSKPEKQQPRHDTADISEHGSRIEHVEANDHEEEFVFKPKQTFGQKFCELFCCCFKKPKREPLLYRSQSSVGSDDKEEFKVDNLEV